jgi:predicted PurR-regulated permease PerM
MSSGDSRRLSELTVGDAKRILVYGVVVVLAVGLFVLLVGKVLVALLLGVVAGVYLLPVQEWLEKRLRARAGSALITIALIVVPLVAITSYAWYELSDYSPSSSSRSFTSSRSAYASPPTSRCACPVITCRFTRS